MDLTADEQFFYDHAAWSYAPAKETPDEGQERCARELAAAERRLIDGPYFVAIEPDPYPWDGDEPYDGPLWAVSLFSAAGTSDPECIGSLGSVACEPGDDYLRVIAAELADAFIDGKIPSDPREAHEQIIDSYNAQ